MFQHITLGIFWPFKEIDAPHIFAPANDLTDKPFSSIDRHIPVLPRLFNSLTDLQRPQQPNIQIGRQNRMIQKRMPFQHSILIVTKTRQSMFNKVIQRLQRLSPRRRIPKRPQITKVVPEPRFNQRQNLLNHLIRFKPQRPLNRHITGGRLAIVVIIVPLVPRRFVALHQQARLAPHVAVKILHPQRFTPLGPSLELRMAGDEPVIGQDMRLDRRVLQLLDQPPLARLGTDHPDCPGFLCASQQLAYDRPCIVGIIQPRIMNIPPILTEFMGKFAHRSKEKRDLLGVMPHVFRFFGNLCHHDNIAALVRLFQCRKPMRELIPQHQNKTAHQGTSLPAQS